MLLPWRGRVSWWFKKKKKKKKKNWTRTRSLINSCNGKWFPSTRTRARRLVSRVERERPRADRQYAQTNILIFFEPSLIDCVIQRLGGPRARAHETALETKAKKRKRERERERGREKCARRGEKKRGWREQKPRRNDVQLNLSSRRLQLRLY